MRNKIIYPLLLTTLLVINGNVKAQSEKIQTAIIYQLTRLIDWCPNGKEGNFTIGVLGDDAILLNELNALKGRKVAEQSIEIKQLTDVNKAGTVNILFVSRTRISDLPKIMLAIGSGCTLVVADKPGAAGEGAAVSFVEKDGRIQFEINKTYAQTHSLTMNNKLIELATHVY